MVCGGIMDILIEDIYCWILIDWRKGVMKLIKTEDAVGHVLCHDITQIIRGVTKDTVFRKGHIVTKEDIPVF